MIRSKLKWLMLAREEKDGEKQTYRLIAERTGLSTGPLVRLAKPEGVKQVDANVLSVLCRYFGCQVGDLLEYVPDEPAKDAVYLGGGPSSGASRGIVTLGNSG